MLDCVRCGSVYITPSDSTTKVVQAVLATPTVKEKKRRAIKYTVAVGTSHGHVQAFLKDSEVVLGAFDQCPAEEKCLMLIKRPKESSKRLSKAQSGHNLSMSDTQLYRQFDGTAFNSPYTAHRMKDKPNSAKDDRGQMSSEIYSTEPRVRRAAGPAAISAAHRKWPAARPNNTFVPIPELGIYTPEQHVLQNGTYAQHCHLREVNNNSHATNGRRNAANGNGNGSAGRYDNNKPLSARTTGSNNVSNLAYSSNHQNNINNNTNHNSSFNSSFDESVSSYGYAPVKGVLRGYDPSSAVGAPVSGTSRYPSGDVYHSCVDISHTYRDGAEDEFNTLSSRRSYDPPGYAPIREEEAGLVRGRPRSPERPNRRRGERDLGVAGYRHSEDISEEDAAKMDSNARSFSLGDLSQGLTFSLAGQQKSGSVTAVNGGGGRKTRGLSSPGLAPKSVRPAPSAASISSSDKEEGSSALRHIRERLQKAVFKSQDKKNNGGKQQPSQTSRSAQGHDTSPHHYQRRSDNKQTPHQQQRERQDHSHPDSQRTSHPSTYQRQMSAPEGAHVLMSSPRNRRDSGDTTSSYRSAQSDTSNFANGNPNPPVSSSGFHNGATGRINKNNPQTHSSSNNNISNSSNSISSTLNNTDSSGNSFATAKSTSTITNNCESNNGHNANGQPSSRDNSTASPAKPKRSLPSVPLSETSERIKRFTEMMKSRMSTGSRTGSRNGSRSGSSAKHTPTQRSTDSACSHTSLSRKSSMETASDSEVFTINNGTGGTNARLPSSGGVGTTKQHQHQLQNGILPNQYPDFHDRKNNHIGNPPNGFTAARHDDQDAPMSKGYNGHSLGQHSHRPLTSEDTPLPPGDRSTDSGQTTGTNQSYTGSAMDSGYTTNNDAENDSFNTNNQQQHLQHHQHFQSLEPGYQQRHQHPDFSRHQHHQPHQNHPQHHHQKQPLSPPHPTNHKQYSSSTSKPQPTRTVNGQGGTDLQLPAFSDRQLENCHRPQIKRNSNLMNSHRFGSVQNVSSAQAHGNPRDTDLIPVNESTPNWHRQQQLSHTQRPGAGALSAREHSSKQVYEKSESSVHDRRPNAGGRRSWDFADARVGNDNAAEMYFPNSNLRKYDRGAAHYKSTEVISHSKPLFTDANYVNTNHIQANDAYQSNNKTNGKSGRTALTLQEQSQAISAKFRTMHLNNGLDAMSHSYHGGLSHEPPHQNGYTSSNGWPSASSVSTSAPKHGNNSQASRTNGNNTGHSHGQRQPQYQKHQSGSGGQVDSKGSNFSLQHQQFHDKHQLHPPHVQHHHTQQQQQHQNHNTNGSGNNSNSNGEVVKLRPVPMSRANRNARGRTLPGGFRFTDAEIAAAGAAGDSKSSLPNGQVAKQPGQDQGQDVMLFHLTQKFDLCPLLVNLPRHVSLRDLAELSEFLVEISLVGVPGAGGSPLGGPNSPQGPVASKIGSPGSAFTPVRNSQDYEAGGAGAGSGPEAGKMITAKVKVIRFARVWGEELQRHTTLGRLLEGDIVVEVNGWFCLGTDVTYLAQVVESCQGAITFTVARPKESEEKRFKGQTPEERVKGLEAEISRLDEIIHAKDEKIREMTSSRDGPSNQQATLTAINGEVPVEGMVIGEDEYVV